MLTLYNKNYDIAKIEKTVTDLSKCYIIEEKLISNPSDKYLIRRWSNGYVELEGYVNTSVMARDEHGALLYRIPVKVRNNDASVFSSQENCTSTYFLRPGFMNDGANKYIEFIRIKFYDFSNGISAPTSYREGVRWRVSGFEIK